MEDPRQPHRPVTRSPSLGDRVRAAVQVPLPQHALSRLVLRLTRSRLRPLKSALVRFVVRAYDVDLSQAANADPASYPSFNAFFTRALAPGARPLATTADAVVSPVDGVVSQAGRIDGGRIFQAKGRSYTATELLGGDPERAAPFRDGAFATLYLSPRDYHRIHMPVAGRLREMVHVPGRLYSVDSRTTRAVPRLFARNERVAALFDTPAGPLALVAVGALFVSGIETVWSGLVTPPRGRRLRVWQYPEAGRGAVRLERGEEMGRFNMGSTVILLFGPGRVEWNELLAPEAPVRMGAAVGRVLAGGGGNIPPGGAG